MRAPQEDENLETLIDRVLVNEIEALPPRRALQLGSSSPTVAFLRDDGWILGAPYGLEIAAYKMWPDQWTHFTRDFKKWVPIAEFGKVI